VKIPRPTKAFVLAAGYGTRMLPLSRDLPKPLMPIWGRPILEHVLRLLRRWGVRDVLINIHHQPGDLLNFVRGNPVPGLRIALSFEPAILGTGGALRRAEWFLDQESFWLINADIAADLNPEPLLRTYAARNPLAALWMHDFAGPQTVEMRSGFVTDFHSSKAGSPGTYTFCGLHLLSSRILRYVPQDGFSSIIAAYDSAMRKGGRIAGVCVPNSFWADIGAPQQYLEAHRDVLRRQRAGLPGRRLFDADVWKRIASARRTGVAVAGFAAIGDNVQLARGATITDSVIWNDATVAARCQVTSAIVGRGASVSGEVRHIALRADVGLDTEEVVALKQVGWEPASATAISFGPRGSARTFTRIRRGNGAPRSVILMRYSLERKENALYCGIARFLKGQGFNVPTVVLEQPRHRLAVLEDLGDRSLEQVRATAGGSELRRIYRKVLDQVALLHTKITQAVHRRRMPLMPPFSPELYRWERNLFAEHFLQKHLHLPTPSIRRIDADLAAVAARLGHVPQVLVHRDLQSSNIFLRRGEPFFIDFQGMRYGAAAYDLASLLCDPYVMLDETLQLELLEGYIARTRDRAVRDVFWWGAVERLAQALGAYGRLSSLAGMQSFARHIPPAMAMLNRALAHVEDLASLKKLAADFR